MYKAATVAIRFHHVEVLWLSFGDEISFLEQEIDELVFDYAVKLI